MATAVVRGVLHTYDWAGAELRQGAGDGAGLPTLVFIHGWLLSRCYWQPIIERLSQFYPCLNYDLRGFGESSARNLGDRYPEQGFTLRDYAEDLRELLVQLNIDKAWLVGHSLGGSIALWAADQHGDRIEGVICLNSGGGIYLKEDFEKFRSAGQKLIKVRVPWMAHIPFLQLAFTRLMVVQQLEKQWGKQRIQDFLAADSRTALGALLDTTTEQEVHHLPRLVAQLKQPVYFLAGSQDSVMEPKYVYHLASFHHSFGTEGKNVIEIEQCGHLAMVEQVARVSEILLEILGQNLHGQLRQKSL